MDLSHNSTSKTSLSSILTAALAQSEAQTEECQQLRTSLQECQAQIAKWQHRIDSVEKLRQENKNLHRELQSSIKESRLARQNADRLFESYELVLEDNHLKQAKIDVLDQQLQQTQSRRKLCERFPPLSSSDEPEATPDPAFASKSSQKGHTAVNQPPMSTSALFNAVEERLEKVRKASVYKKRTSEMDPMSAPTKRVRRSSSSSVSSTLQVLATPGRDRPSCSLNRGDINPVGEQILRELSGNEQTAAKTKTGRETPAMIQPGSLPPEGDRLGSNILTIAEDGENYEKYPMPTSVTANKNQPAADPSAHRRLGELLSEPKPRKSLLYQPTPTVGSNLSKSSPIEAHTSKRFLPSKALSTASKPSADSLPKKRAPFLPPKRPPKATPAAEDDEPLRARPVQRLSLCHFKINPATNGGLDYAFNSVVRNQSLRKCLPGCTDQRCCGDAFRALAATLPGMAAYYSDTRDPTEHEINSCISEHDLLVSMLGGPGPEADGVIRTLTPIARRNLIHDARIRLLANLYGKQHRDEHSRRASSPPGFWRTEFPLSQEEKADRIEAERREREEVKQRYEDAMRGGGRWLFADE